MAYSNQVTVTTTAGLLVRREESRTYLVKTTASTVYLGGADVTSSTGYLMAPNVEYEIPLEIGEFLYGITSSGTATVYLLGIA